MAIFFPKKLKLLGLRCHGCRLYFKNVFTMVCLLLPLATIKLWNGESRTVRRSDAAEFKVSHDKQPTEEIYQIMNRQLGIPKNKNDQVPFKKILYWNKGATPSAFPENFGLGVGRDVYKKVGCSVWQCETSEDRTNTEEYDAVLFHYMYFNGSDLPSRRSPHQRYVFFEYESPSFLFSGRGYFLPRMMYNFFNWTMTYRWDSDVVHPYGWIEPSNGMPVKPEEIERLRSVQTVNYAAGKTKMAATMVTNCKSQSGRLRFVKELIEYGVQTDVYGACGNLTCGINNYHSGVYKTDESDEPCRQMVGETYKFYFAFENSVCVDYVTEKFYAMMRFPVLLVVMDAHGNHVKAAPPHSYINALDFPSVGALAEYLITLDKNDTLYNEYFWWKSHYEVRNSLLSGIYRDSLCSLCSVLHNPPDRSVQKVYKDMVDWWVNQANCKEVLVDGVYVDDVFNDPTDDLT